MQPMSPCPDPPVSPRQDLVDVKQEDVEGVAGEDQVL